MSEAVEQAGAGEVTAAELALAGLDLLGRGVPAKARTLAERALAVAPDEPRAW